MAPGRPDGPAEGLIEGILQRGETAAAPAGDASELLTFLFADVRGYTRFTQERGDEAAAKLTAKFAAIVRELVPRFGGTLFEQRGDEALCVFGSPRQSLRLAIALQQRFVAETAAEPELPMTVGIGIDVGEAVRGEHGYRGGALNLAARLCAHAKAGAVLVSPEVAHLAGAIDGIRYVTLDRVTFKGVSDRVRPTLVRPEGEDPAQQIAALLASAAPPARSKKWPWLIVAGAAVVAAVVAAALVVVLNHDSGDGTVLGALSENSVGILDPGSGRLVGQVHLDAEPSAVAAGFDSVWTANTDANTVSQVDIATRRVVRTIDVGTGPAAIAVGPNAVWVVNSASASVSRIDPSNNHTDTIPVGNAPRGVVVAHGSVWVTNSGNGTVSRIDPNRNEVADTIPVGAGPSGIAAGRDIWVANSAANTVTQIDGSTHAVTHTVTVGTAPKSVAVVGDTVWVTNTLGGTVSRIGTSGGTDPQTTTIGSQPTQLAAVDDHLWIATQGSRSVAELDPASARVVDSVLVGPIPGGLVAADGKLWVTTTINPALHRGGTLHILGPDIGSIDPSYIGSVELNELLNGSYDGLVAFAHATGADSTAIVPDLATTMPAPTNGGRSYTFQLRAGIRWSTGAPLTVFDVRRGIERSLAIGFAIPLSNQIVGSRGCRPKRCEVSGIVADAGNRTLTINLYKPNGNFIDDLATSGTAVPAATPLVDVTTHPVPVTGPYQIASYVPGKLVVLTRNRYFHEWSAAAQPAGYPDRIEWRIDPSSEDDQNKPAVDAVAANRADWADARFVPDSRNLAPRFGTRVHYTPTQTLHALFLNTHIPPFNDVRVRRALAFALDRRAIADDWFVPATVTCQILPPNYSGYRPYCPYTLGRDDRTGDWRAPDFPRALDLVRQSHTAGMRITVYDGRPSAHAFGHIVDALNELGYHARLVVYKGDDYFDYVTDSRHKVQAGFYGWVNSDATAANLLDLYRCSAYMPASPNNLNPAGSCDHSIDRIMDQARQVESSSIAAANGLWEQADRRLVDEAPWIPLVTPTWVDVTSTRVHNYKRSPSLGMLYDQMWLR
jgi:YVTN family beta-propeller protein